MELSLKISLIIFIISAVITIFVREYVERDEKITAAYIYNKRRKEGIDAVFTWPMLIGDICLVLAIISGLASVIIYIIKL